MIDFSAVSALALFAFGGGGIGLCAGFIIGISLRSSRGRRGQ